MSGRDAVTQLFYRAQDRVSVWPAVAARGRNTQTSTLSISQRRDVQLFKETPHSYLHVPSWSPTPNVAGYVVDHDGLTDLIESACIPCTDVTAQIQYADGRSEWCKVVAEQRPTTAERDPEWATAGLYRVIYLGDYPGWQVKF